jgi:hypothetical protein
MNDARQYTQINAKSLALEGVQFGRLRRPISTKTVARVEELQDKKKWYCGTMISPFAGPKTDAESNWGKSEISYSALSAKNLVA